MHTPSCGMAILLLNTPEAGRGLAGSWPVASARVGVFNFIYGSGWGGFGDMGVVAFAWPGGGRESLRLVCPATPVPAWWHSFAFLLADLGQRAGAGLLACGHSFARRLAHLYPNRALESKAIFVLLPCRLAVAFVEGVAGYGETKRQARCRQQDERAWKTEERQPNPKSVV